MSEALKTMEESEVMRAVGCFTALKSHCGLNFCFPRFPGHHKLFLPPLKSPQNLFARRLLTKVLLTQ